MKQELRGFVRNEVSLFTDKEDNFMCSDKENMHFAKQEYVKWSSLGMSLEKLTRHIL